MHIKPTILHNRAPFLVLIGAIITLLTQNACIQHRQLVNFDEGPVFDSLVMKVTPPALQIQPDDLLAISVLSQTADPQITAPFRTSAVDRSGGGGGTQDAPQYLVDAAGMINMPLVGQVRLAGLTTQMARDTLESHLSRFLKKPIVNVRISNFRFSVLGEVNRAGTYSIPYERVNALEALGQAGDLTKYGNRENVLVIRQTNGIRRYGRLNLHDRKVLQSPYFYLEQNDIIYVEPLKAKVGDTSDALISLFSK
ncbi:MAG: polysaccharide biosynthesis/export family protein [Thermoanaerobaculia bacterium]|nr:polysaccharide biosynthesis/export family protein [Thermoanaerobaculia bacterium]